MPRADRGGGAGLRGGKAAARLLRAPRGAGLGGARARRRGGAGCRPARHRGREARRRPAHRRRPMRARHLGADGLGADAVTVNPLLGADSLDPWVDAAAGAGAGLFVLVRTSNPGAAHVLDLETPGGPVHEHLAAMVAAERRLDGAGGLSGMGAVVGATAPERLGRLRELMPASIFLLPGVGAQGGERGRAGSRARRAPGVDPGAGLPRDLRGAGSRRRGRRPPRRALVAGPGLRPLGADHAGRLLARGLGLLGIGRSRVPSSSRARPRAPRETIKACSRWPAPIPRNRRGT